MCGFLGEISSQLLEHKRFKSLLDLSIHRGPDAQDIWQSGNCQLGFNRLAILDVTDAAMQPVISPSGRYALVFNGEIYNYKQLQQTFQIPDSALRSHSDTEVLVQLLDNIPFNELVSQLNGMFAIAVWDIEKAQLYLARDFSGIKPLFYGIKDSSVVFASQFNQIFKHRKFSDLTLRPEIMKEYFGLGYMHAPNTVFKDIYQVEPGQYIIWDFKAKAITQKKNYYNWATNPLYPDDNEQTRVLFSKHFNETIKSQLQSDVPIATFLSSGYDSTLVTAYAKQHKADINAFTFGVDNQDLDESGDAKVYAACLSVSHIIEHSSTNELLDIVDDHFKTMPEPFGDYSSVPTYLITNKAKQYASVMLSGDGGDELFWGYPRFRKSVNQSKWFRYPLWLRKIIVPCFRIFNKKLSNALEVMPSFSDWILQKQLNFTGLDILFPRVNFSDELYKTYAFKKTHSKPNILQYLKKNEFFAHMQRTLKKVDLTSMANSLEVRVPFLDKKIITFSNEVLPQFGIKHDRPKLILKDELYQFIDISKVSKTKKGFSVPIENWLKNELKDDFFNTVLHTPFYGETLLNKAYLEQLVSDFYNDKQGINYWGIWHIYAWQKWAINNKLV